MRFLLSFLCFSVYLLENRLQYGSSEAREGLNSCTYHIIKGNFCQGKNHPWQSPLHPRFARFSRNFHEQSSYLFTRFRAFLFYLLNNFF